MVRSFKARLLAGLTLCILSALVSCHATGGIEAIATFGAGQAPHGSLSGDVSVLVALKEGYGFALDRLMAEVPSDMMVYYVVYTPITDPTFWNRLSGADAKYDNLHLIYGAPPYVNVGGSRRFAMQSGLITTKYVLFVENIAYPDPGLVRHLYLKAEALRAEEAAKGQPLTVSFVPGMIEECDKGDLGMWGRDLFKSHALWSPSLLNKNGDSFFASGYMNGVSDTEFQVKDDVSAWNTTLKVMAEKSFEATGVPGVHYVNFLEDHIWLQDTQFFKDHLNEYCLTDIHWKDDMFHLAAVPLFFNRRVAFVPGPVGRMDFFCEWSPESLQQFAWRRSDAAMIRSCLLEEYIYDYTMASGNCWAWMNGFKDNLFARISITDVPKEFPRFQPEEPLASLRHTNLMFSAFLFSSHSEFRFEFREKAPSKTKVQTGWLEPTEALRFVLAELSERDEESKRSNMEQFVYMRQRVMDVRSEHYQDLLLSRNERLTLMPGAFKQKLASRSTGNNQFSGILTDLPDYCLYHTGYKRVKEFGDTIKMLKNMATFSTIKAPKGPKQMDFFFWTAGKRDCPASLETPGGNLELITGQNVGIQIPAFDGDTSISVLQYRYSRIAV